MAPARGATTMIRLGKPMRSYHGSGRACPCHVRLHPLFHSPAESCGGAQKKKKKFFGDTPNPGRRLRPLHSRLLELLPEKFGMTHICFSSLYSVYVFVHATPKYMMNLKSAITI